MGVFQRIQCIRGSHHRNSRSIWLEGNAYHSRCSGCGKPMVRGLGGWSLVEEGRPDPIFPTSGPASSPETLL